MNKNDKTTLILIGGIVFLAIAAAITAIVTMNTRGGGGSGLSKEFTYDIEHLKKIDPAQIIYEEAGEPIPTGYSQPVALAVGPEDVIYVAGGSSVRTFSSDGEPGKLELSLETEPSCLAVAHDGLVYVGMRDHLEVYSPEGRLVKRWASAGPDALFTSIAVGEDTVYAAEFGKKEVLRYDLTGGALEPMGEFVIPSPYFDLVLDHDGLLHVANTGVHNIEAYTSEGNLQSFWGNFSNTDTTFFSGCCNPVNMALLPEGKGFVTTEKGLTRVKVFDSAGEFQGFVAGPESFARHDSLCNAPGYDLTRVGLDVAVDSAGRILVLDPATAEIRIFVSKTGK